MVFSSSWEGSSVLQSPERARLLAAHSSAILGRGLRPHGTSWGPLGSSILMGKGTKNWQKARARGSVREDSCSCHSSLPLTFYCLESCLWPHLVAREAEKSGLYFLSGLVPGYKILIPPVVEVNFVSMKEEEFGPWERANSFCHCLIFLNGEVENGVSWGKQLFSNMLSLKQGTVEYRVMG